MRSRTRPRAPLAPSLIAVMLAAMAVSTSLTASSPARAGDAASAQALFDEAMALKEKEDWAAACPKFESSYKLDPALGTLLNLANCFEKIDKIASAWARWEEAYQWATKNGDERVEYAKTQRDKLVGRLPKLQIDVTSKAAALTIERDDTKIAEAMYGVALPVDPGEHVVFVKRDDEILKTEKIKVVESQSATLSLDLAAIEKAAPPPKPKGNVIVVGGTSPALRKAGWAIGATGLATVLAAAALETVALSRKSDTAPYCVDKLCTPKGKAIADEAATFAEAGQWVGIGGLVVTAVGITLLIVSPSTTPPADVTGAPKKDARGPRDVWALPWIAPEPPAAGASPTGAGFAGGIVLGGHL
ncbi:MAG: hypothetical protein R3B70_19395 [Polyangiaceae bacterium]